MDVWLDLLIYCLFPIVVLIPFVAAIHWLLDRIFGEEGDGIGFAPKMQADFFQKSAAHIGRKARESKLNPHYDALVDEEWRISRLEDEYPEFEAEEEQSLGDLLERKH
jgi:hypothetical protein